MIILDFNDTTKANSSGYDWPQIFFADWTSSDVPEIREKEYSTFL